MRNGIIVSIVAVAFVIVLAAERSLLAADCNTNGIDDTTDIAAGTSQDCNSNGIPDECDISGDVITEIIDGSGDGAGNGLIFPHGIAVDAAGNAYVTGLGTDNAFKINAPSASLDDCRNGIPDECETDDDLDGVPNDCDVCPCTPAPFGVDANGRPKGDLNEDCKVNLVDFNTFSGNFGQSPAPDCP